MKKGASHVDWAISMGIFLIYILLTFIFLKPASEPAYSGETLINTVYSGLKNDTAYTIQKKYFAIKPTSDIQENQMYFLRIRNFDQSGMNMEWVESDKPILHGGKGEKHLMLMNGSLDKIPCENSTDIIFDFVQYNKPNEYIVLEMETTLEKGKDNPFLFLYSEEFEFCPHRTVEQDPSKIELTDETCVQRDPITGNKRYDCLLDSVEVSPEFPKDDTNFTYQFGIVESFTAFSEKKLNDFNQSYNENYEGLKKVWGFPADKNFNITIEKIG